MGVTASSSSSSWSAGLRNGVRSSPSVAVAVPVTVAGLELRGVAELEVVGPAIALAVRCAGAGWDLRRAPGSATIHDAFCAGVTLAQNGCGSVPTDPAAEPAELPYFTTMMDRPSRHETSSAFILFIWVIEPIEAPIPTSSLCYMLEAHITRPAHGRVQPFIEQEECKSEGSSLILLLGPKGRLHLVRLMM